MYLTDREIERFLAKIDFGDCWLWTASTRKSGYGQFRISHPRTTVEAHRVAAWLWICPDLFETKLTVDHVKEVCGRKLCLKPGHIEVVTQAENNRRAHKLEFGDYCHNGGHLQTEQNRRLQTSGYYKCLDCHAEGERRRRRAR